MVDAFNQQRQRLVAGTGFDFVNTIHSPEVERIGGQAVERIGRHPENFALAKFLRRIGDERRLGFRAVDLDNFGVQEASLGLGCKRRKLTYHFVPLQVRFAAGNRRLRAISGLAAKAFGREYG
jgi:hypothetical protein